MKRKDVETTVDEHEAAAAAAPAPAKRHQAEDVLVPKLEVDVERALQYVKGLRKGTYPLLGTLITSSKDKAMAASFSAYNLVESSLRAAPEVPWAAASIWPAGVESPTKTWDIIAKATSATAIAAGSQKPKVLTVQLAHIEHSGEFDAKHFADLYNQAEISGFGNMAELKTDHDVTVRQSREFLNPIVPASLLCRVRECWQRSGLLPYADIEVRPYKMILYDKGGHFAAHRDTPEPHLVGSIVMSLDNGQSAWDDEDRQAPYLQLTDGDATISDKAKYPGHMLMFYPDVLHEVKAGNGQRISLSFKVFHHPSSPDIVEKEEKASGVPKQVQETMKHLQALLNVPGLHGVVGLVLRHHYPTGLDVKSDLKGRDVLLITAARHLAASDPTIDMRVLPVSIHSSTEVPVGEQDEHIAEEDRTSATVHLLPVTIDDRPPTTFYKQQVNFFGKAKSGHLFSRFEDEGAEHTGNSCRSGSIDCVYVSRVLVLARQSALKGRDDIAKAANTKPNDDDDDEDGEELESDDYSS